MDVNSYTYLEESNRTIPLMLKTNPESAPIENDHKRLKEISNVVTKQTSCSKTRKKKASRIENLL